jgi:hypothetical protein
MRRLTLLSVWLLACGGRMNPPPDAGMIDTSCGIDCVAQNRYGLITGTCFEYSDMMLSPANPPALAAEVKAMRSLEGDVPVLDVVYTVGGQRKQQDSFTIANGELKLVRREFGTGGTSVSYKDTSGKLIGATWLTPTSSAGENETTSTSADVVNGASRMSDATTYRVTLSAGAVADLQTPLETFDGGVKLLITESPTDHGSDSRRVYVPGTGFVLIATPLALSGGSSQEYRLQIIKNVADAGTLCGF